MKRVFIPAGNEFLLRQLLLRQLKIEAIRASLQGHLTNISEGFDFWERKGFVMKKKKAAAVFLLGISLMLAFLGLGFMKVLLAKEQLKILSQTGNIPIVGMEGIQGEIRQDDGTSTGNSNFKEDSPLRENDGHNSSSVSSEGSHSSAGSGTDLIIVTDASMTADSDNTEEGTPQYSEYKEALSFDEIRTIVESMEFAVNEEPHEPYGNQLNMEEAVEKGLDWINERYTWEKDGWGSFKMISARLCRKAIFPGVPWEYYSYWCIEYHMEDKLSVDLYLNAVTGRPLKAEISAYTQEIDFTKFDNDTMEKIVTVFADDAGLEERISESCFLPGNNGGWPFAYLDLGDGELYVVLRTYSIRYQFDTGRSFHSDVEIYLSTSME